MLLCYTFIFYLFPGYLFLLFIFAFHTYVLIFIFISIIVNCFEVATNFFVSLYGLTPVQYFGST